MPKKTKNQIFEYYSRSNVVTTYDDRRFSGPGGNRINQTEVGEVVKAIDRVGLKKNSILDLGAGRGRLSLPLKKSGYEVFCLDSSQDMIKVLKKNFSKDHLLTQSIFDPIKLTRKVNIISSLRFFDHFSLSDQKKILQNIDKKLSKDGYIIFACLNKNSLESKVARFFPYSRYNYFYSDHDYRKMFKGVKFEVLSRKSCFFFPRGSFLYAQKMPGVFSLVNVLDYLLIKLFPGAGAYFVYTLHRE